MNDHQLAALFRAVVSNSLEKAAAEPTPDCSPLARFRSALLHEDWTAAEARHKKACPNCRQVEGQVRELVWHPSPADLFRHSRQVVSSGEVGPHLDEEGCRPCGRLLAVLQANRILNRLATRAGQMTERRERLLASMLTGRQTAAPARALRFDFGAGKTRAMLYPEERRMVLEGASPMPGSPSLLHVLLGGEGDQVELLVLPREPEGTSVPNTTVFFEQILPHRLVPVLLEIEVSDLAAEDIPLLRASFAAAVKDNRGPAWQTWAQQAKQLAGLDASLQRALTEISRASDPPPPQIPT